MTDDISALDARHIRTHFRAAVALWRDEYARVQRDQNLSDEGRKKALAPLASRLEAAHDSAARALAPLEAAAEAAVVHYSPGEVRRRAAALAPAKAAGAAQLAALEEPAGFLSLVHAVMVAPRDDATAHGLTLALRKRTDLSPEERKAITAELDAPHRPRADRALATLVGIKVEMQRHALEGPLGDAVNRVQRDPSAVITASLEAASYLHPGTGERLSLSDDAAARMLDAAGLLTDIGQAAATAPRFWQRR